MPQTITHPLTRAEYSTDPAGKILVRHEGKSGRFDGNGEWISGDLKTADPEMCRWMESGYVFEQMAAAKGASTAETEALPDGTGMDSATKGEQK